MIRRLALAASFAVLGAVAFTPKAHGQAAPAANEPVPFSGTIGSVCTLTDPQPGTLAQQGDLLASSVPGGAVGKVTVNCTGGNEVSVGVPSPVNVPQGFTPVPNSQRASLLENGNPFTDSFGAAPGSVTPGGDVVLDVDMEVINGGAVFPAGVYEYNVPVTAAPN